MADKDSVILENLITLAKGIASQFGRNCEICIHDLSCSDLEHTIVFIVNGHVTGRKVGDGPSKIVLETVERLKTQKNPVDHLGYMTHTKKGTILKSSSLFLKGADGRYRYLLGINYDITNLVGIDDGLRSLITTEEETKKDAPPQIPTSVNELLDSLIEQSAALIGKPPALMNKSEKVRAIQFLNDSGAFLITKSGDKVSSYYGISKFTLYSYIDVNKPKKGEN